MRPIIIADSDDDDEHGTNAGELPATAPWGQSPTNSGRIAPMTTTARAANTSSSNPTATPNVQTGSTDELVFQRIYHEHNEASLRQFAIQNNATSPAKMGQPSNRTCSGAENSVIARDPESSSDARDEAQQESSFLTESAHPSKGTIRKQGKKYSLSDASNITIPGRLLDLSDGDDPYDFPGSSPVNQSRAAVTMSKHKKGSAFKGGRSQGTTHDGGTGTSSLTHITETPVLVQNSMEQAQKSSRGSLDLSQEVDGAAAAPHEECLVIQSAPMTISQTMEYQSVNPSPIANGSNDLVDLAEVEHQLSQASSNDISTIAFPTPNRYQAGPDALNPSTTHATAESVQVGPELAGESLGADQRGIATYKNMGIADAPEVAAQPNHVTFVSTSENLVPELGDGVCALPARTHAIGNF